MSSLDGHGLDHARAGEIDLKRRILDLGQDGADVFDGRNGDSLVRAGPGG